MITGTTTNGDDAITGTFRDERLEGDRGNDTLIGGGGEDTLVGDDGNDVLIARNSSGITGLRGGNGDDYMMASLPGAGQIHMFGMAGNDTLVMDLTKDGNAFRSSDGQQINFMGHHAYGGTGADTFSFVNVNSAAGLIIGRIDDFNASEDQIFVAGSLLDFDRLPSTVKIFEYNQQQWMQMGQNAFYVLEGARDGGAERHFLATEEIGAMLRASRDPDAEVGYTDPVNEVPDWLVNSDISVRSTFCLDGYNNELDFVGTQGDDVVDDTRLRNGKTSPAATDNTFEGMGGNDLINAGKGNDTISGGDGNDSLAGGMDNDRIWGGAGDDMLFGGSEDDRLHGGTGDDVLEGSSGNDTLYGEQDNDVLRGGSGRDLLYGGDNNDRMGGGDGDDTLHGEQGNDRMYGEAGDDLMRGGAGRDTLWAGDGNDTLDGGSWNDRLYGQSGNDTLIGGQGRDTLRGDDGDDWINGGADADMAWGGAGADRFAFNDQHIADWDTLEGSWEERARLLDRIEDFEAGIDTIALSGFAGTTNLSGLRGADFEMDGTNYTMITLTATNHRLLVHVENGEGWSALATAENFDFV